jgi:hypothetical protein
MIRYLREESDRLSGFKSGILKNSTKWAANATTTDTIQSNIDLLNAKEKQIENTQTLLAQQQLEAKTLKLTCSKFGDEVENFIYAYHPGEQEKLLDYGIEPRKSYTKKQMPSSKLLVSIQDDTDGEGFILTTQSDADADMYEWYKGVGADAAKPDIIPVMMLFKTTKKITLVDDDVVKGTRVFYKVRAINSKGEGPWSEAVSKVQ